MLVKCFVDESGLDGPRVVLAGYVAPSYDWIGFQRQWQKLLARESIPYSHITEMTKGDEPFAGWDGQRISQFVRQASPLIDKYISFGITVGVNKEHRAAYAANMPPRTHADSDYGMCARQFFEVVPTYVELRLGMPDAKIDFIFERQDQRFGDAVRIFNDLKAVSPHFQDKLGSISAGEGATSEGLQCADLLAYTARRFEPTSTFMEVPRDPKVQTREQREILKKCPIYRLDIGEDAIAAYHEVATEIARVKRQNRQRAKAKRRRTKEEQMT